MDQIRLICVSGIDRPAGFPPAMPSAPPAGGSRSLIALPPAMRLISGRRSARGRLSILRNDLIEESGGGGAHRGNYGSDTLSSGDLDTLAGCLQTDAGGGSTRFPEGDAAFGSSGDSFLLRLKSNVPVSVSGIICDKSAPLVCGDLPLLTCGATAARDTKRRQRVFAARFKPSAERRQALFT